MWFLCFVVLDKEKDKPQIDILKKKKTLLCKKNPTNIYCNNNENTLALAHTHKLSHKIKY